MYYQKTKWTTAKKQVFDGIKYDSGFEARQAQDLTLLQKAKEIKGFEAHVKIPLIWNGYIICNYYIDFKVFHNDGTIEYIETKGYQTSEWKLKWKMLEAMTNSDPNYKMTLVQQGKFKPPKTRRVKV